MHNVTSRAAAARLCTAEASSVVRAPIGRFTAAVDRMDARRLGWSDRLPKIALRAKDCEAPSLAQPTLEALLRYYTARFPRGHEEPASMVTPDDIALFNLSTAMNAELDNWQVRSERGRLWTGSGKLKDLNPHRVARETTLDGYRAVLDSIRQHPDACCVRYVHTHFAAIPGSVFSRGDVAVATQIRALMDLDGLAHVDLEFGIVFPVGWRTQLGAYLSGAGLLGAKQALADDLGLRLVKIPGALRAGADYYPGPAFASAVRLFSAAERSR